MVQTSRRSIWLCIIILLVFLPSNLFAQEATETPSVPISTEPSPVATATSDPISTATNTATPAVTTASPTENVVTPETLEATDNPVMAESTAEVTQASSQIPVEATAETTVEVAEVISPTTEQTETVLQPEPEPELTAVVSDAFIDATNPNWTLGAGWQLVPHDDNYALQGTDTTEAVTYNQQSFSDVAVEALVQADQMTMELHLRQSETGSYLLTLSPDGTVTVSRGDLVLASANIAPSVPDQWRHVRFSAIGYTLRVAIDGVEVLVTTDAQPLPEGQISLTGTTTSTDINSIIMVDNVRFWIPQSEIATVTPTSSVPEVSSVASISTNLVLAYTDYFEDIVFPGWTSDVRWNPILHQTGRALGMGNAITTGYLNNAHFYNMSVNADVLIYAGSIQLAVRHDTNNHYAAELSDSGTLNLYRSGALIQTTTVPSLITHNWYRLGISAVEDEVEVMVDDVTYITYTDPLPLAAGTVAIPSYGNSDALLDNLSLYVSSNEQISNIGYVVPNRTQLLLPTTIVTNSETPTNSQDIVFGDPFGVSPRYMRYANYDTPEISTPIDTSTAHDVNFSQQGDKLIYSRRNSISNTLELHVMLVDVNGNYGSRTKITDGTSAAWSPDGDWIVFVRPTGIFVRNIETEAEFQIAENDPNYTYSNPDWHPFENKIIYTKSVTGSSCAECDIWEVSISLDGTGMVSSPTNLTNTDDYRDHFGEYSHDGSQIAYIRLNDIPDAELWVMDESGNGQHVVVEIDESFSQGISGLDWSPDDNLIMFLVGSASTGLTQHVNVDSGTIETWQPFYASGIAWRNTIPIDPPDDPPIGCSGSQQAQNGGIGSVLQTNDPGQCLTSVHIFVDDPILTNFSKSQIGVNSEWESP